MRYRSAFNSGNAYRLADTAGECQQRKFPSERPLDAEAPALECQWDNPALRGPSGRVQRVRVATRREAAGVTRAPRRSRRHAAGSPADRRNSGLLRPAAGAVRRGKKKNTLDERNHTPGVLRSESRMNWFSGPQNLESPTVFKNLSGDSDTANTVTRYCVIGFSRD